MDTKRNETIIQYSKELRLPAFRRDFKELCQEATKQQMEYEVFLLQLMEREY
ncbi:hypothetical protein [Sphingobacterium sp. JB170]|uniref:hypothetical protein n=1 Tax=Sphingobacterium sp. JB170 TaxID=1434842 RepID=UPI00097EEC30|nr:hypothetical protein [Sphingobacterium sp. JB170]SJN49825.1 hypothetical protein FM107_19285 [Sphingobacterium sp. JB170]